MKCQYIRQTGVVVAVRLEGVHSDQKGSERDIRGGVDKSSSFISENATPAGAGGMRTYRIIVHSYSAR